MAFCVQITACRNLILALLLAPSLAEIMTNNTNLYQFNATMDVGSTIAPGFHPNPVSKPESTMAYTEQETLTPNFNNSEGNDTGALFHLDLFDLAYTICATRFERQIKNIGDQQWCNWTAIASLYSNLTDCSERVMEVCNSYWPNAVGEQLLILMHTRYFKDCNMVENRTLIDPPENIVLGLIIAPICIIPIMVALVVWCSKNTEANTKK
ncbi:receptor activity-modifying protein 2 [Cetorhinus maximus]